jgi:hypothetical protein
VRVGQARGRPTRAGGSIASIVAAKRTSIPCRTISCIIGAWLRRSSAVHAIVVVLGSGSTTNGVGGRCVRKKATSDQRLGFRQALSRSKWRGP